MSWSREAGTSTQLKHVDFPEGSAQLTPVVWKLTIVGRVALVSMGPRETVVGLCTEITGQRGPPTERDTPAFVSLEIITPP